MHSLEIVEVWLDEITSSPYFRGYVEGIVQKDRIDERLEQEVVLKNGQYADEFIYDYRG